MKLVNPRLDKHINFMNSNVWLLVIENPNEYYILLNDLIQQENGNEGNWVLSEDNDILNISKSAVLIYDYFNIDFKSKKIDNLIKSTILQVAKEGDFLEKLSNINKEIITLNNDLMSQINLPLIANEDVTFEDVYKISNFSINEDKTLLERISTYVDIFVKLNNAKLVVFVNPFAFLSNDQLHSLIKEFNYKNIKMLFIDYQNRKLPCEFAKIIIDKDLCII